MEKNKLIKFLNEIVNDFKNGKYYSFDEILKYISLTKEWCFIIKKNFFNGENYNIFRNDDEVYFAILSIFISEYYYANLYIVSKDDARKMRSDINGYLFDFWNDSVEDEKELALFSWKEWEYCCLYHLPSIEINHKKIERNLFNNQKWLEK